MYTIRDRVSNRGIARVSTAQEALDVVATHPGSPPWVWDDHGVSELSPLGWRVGTWDLRRLAARDAAIGAALDAGLSAATAARLGQDAELRVSREETLDDRRRAARAPAAFSRLRECYL